MKLTLTAVLCSLGLLAAQAGAEESVVTDAQRIAEQSGTTAIYQTGNTEMILASAQTIYAGAVSQAGTVSGKISRGMIRTRQKTAVGKMNALNKNQKQGNVFLADNETRPATNVVTLPSGMQYLTTYAAGNGVKPTKANFVVCSRCQPEDGASQYSRDKSRNCCSIGCD